MIRIAAIAVVGVLVANANAQSGSADHARCPPPAKDPNLRITCADLGEPGRTKPPETADGIDTTWRTPIELAARAGELDTLRSLLFAPETTPQMRADAAMTAISFGRTEILRALLDAGVSPDSRDSNGGPLVIQASVSGNVEALRLLFERGADLRARMPGKTDDALVFAVVLHQREVIRFLVGSGIDWSASISQSGKSPRQLAELLHDSCALELLQVSTKEVGKNARP